MDKNHLPCPGATSGDQCKVFSALLRDDPEDEEEEEDEEEDDERDDDGDEGYSE
jgi:hypothetical protein